jgi:S-methylmethionine-dependent homocysteine/selenocysteine methylase
MTTDLILGDGGIETDLIFHHGQDLPHFAAFVLLDTDDGRQALRDYYLPYLRIAQQAGAGLVLETPTWRASPDWMALLDRPATDVTAVNAAAVSMLRGLRASTSRSDEDERPVLISGCVGPRRDGYQPEQAMTAAQAQRYHAPQINALAEAGADRVTAITMAYPDEAAGIVLATRDAGVPSVVSFTVETDGRLPDGTLLSQAIHLVDGATDGYAETFMVNCAHPEHLARAFSLAGDDAWRARLGGVRANASTRSHAELDAADDLDEGDPAAFGGQLAALAHAAPSLRLLGGCCGTDHRHIRAVAEAVTGRSIPPAI